MIGDSSEEVQCISDLWEERVGNSDRGCTDNCSKERVKHTGTIFYVVRQIRLHPRERVIVLGIEKGLQQIHGEEEDYITLLNSSTLSSRSCCNGSKAAAIAALSFSQLFCTNSLHSLHFASHIMPLFIGISWQLLHLFCCQTWLQG